MPNWACPSPWSLQNCSLLIPCSWCAPANTSKDGVRLLSPHAKIRKINVNAQKTQVIALKVIKCYSLPWTIKVLIGILYRETQISNKILPWDVALREHGGDFPGNTWNTSKENNALCVWAWLPFPEHLLCFHSSESHQQRRSLLKQQPGGRTATKFWFFKHLSVLLLCQCPLLHATLPPSIPA